MLRLRHHACVIGQLEPGKMPCILLQRDGEVCLSQVNGRKPLAWAGHAYPELLVHDEAVGVLQTMGHHLPRLFFG